MKFLQKYNCSLVTVFNPLSELIQYPGTFTVDLQTHTVVSLGQQALLSTWLLAWFSFSNVIKQTHFIEISSFWNNEHEINNQFLYDKKNSSITRAGSEKKVKGYDQNIYYLIIVGIILISDWGEFLKKELNDS